MIKRPMKGEQIEDLSRLKFPLIAFPKIDGFRCVLQDKPLTSRLSPFPNRHFMKEASGLLSRGLLDGEVTVGKRRGEGVLQRTSSGLTSQEGEPDWHMWAFDCVATEKAKQMGFSCRYEEAEALVSELSHPRIHLLKSRIITSLLELERYIQNKLNWGYEGIMVRSIDGLYKEGKSTINQGWLLKIKPFKDFEAKITGYYEEMHNTNEAQREITGKLKRSSAKAGKVGKSRLGGFIGIDTQTGVEVRVGGGFTEAQRISFWEIRDQYIGQLMTCKKQEVGEKDKPRHPTFIRIRPGWDM